MIKNERIKEQKYISLKWTKNEGSMKNITERNKKKQKKKEIWKEKK